MTSLHCPPTKSLRNVHLVGIAIYETSRRLHLVIVLDGDQDVTLWSGGSHSAAMTANLDDEERATLS